MSNPEDEVITETPEKIPRLWGVVVFRLFVVLLAYLILQQASNWRLSSLLTASVIPIFLLVGIPSFIIAVGLLFRQRWAGWLAIACDVFIIAYSKSLSITESLLMLDIVVFVASGAVLWAFLYEGAYIAERLQKEYRLTLIYRNVAVVMVLAGAATILGQRAIVMHRAGPLIAYADSHWIKMPKNLFFFKSSFAKDPRTGYAVVSFKRDLPYIGRYPQLVEDVTFSAIESGWGRWRIPGNATLDGRVLAAMEVNAMLFDWNDLLSGSKRNKDLVYLRKIGCRQKQLNYKGDVEEVLMFDVFWRGLGRGEFHTTSHGPSWSLQEYSSDQSGTTFYVSGNGSNVVFIRPQKTIEVR